VHIIKTPNKKKKKKTPFRETKPHYIMRLEGRVERESLLVLLSVERDRTEDQVSDSKPFSMSCK
jgi:hypothetical protein